MNVATGVFNSVERAKDAYDALVTADFDKNDIGVVACDRSKGEALASMIDRDYSPDKVPSKGVGGRVYCRLADDYEDTIRDSNLPDRAVNWYQGHLDRGDILLIVRVGDRMGDADRTIHEHGGILYDEEFREPGMRRSEMAQTRMTAPGATYVPIIEEGVYLEKTAHEVGEVEVSPETTMETVEMPATVMHEEIRIERRKLDTPMTPEDYRKRVDGQSGTVRMPVVEEELRVMKKPMIREEMVITRVRIPESKTIREQVQHTEPKVETHGDVHVEETGEVKKRRPAA